MKKLLTILLLCASFAQAHDIGDLPARSGNVNADTWFAVEGGFAGTNSGQTQKARLSSLASWLTAASVDTGAFASPDEGFVTIANTPDLNAERALAVGTGISKTDSGANGSLTLAIGAHTHQDASNGVTLNAAAIAAGTMGTARLGSGAADATKVLRGDSTWAAFTSGTVTSVSVTTANGVSATVADPTTTPALSFVLGAITPSSVNKVTITQPATGATLTIADGKTANFLTSLNFNGTSGASLNIGAGGTLGTAAFTAASAYQPVDTQLTSVSGLSYAGNTLKVLRVNAGETDFELATASAGVTDHGALTGLADDDHTQYGLLAGRAAGQTLNGGTVSGVDEVQTVTVDATGGTFTLTYAGQTTTAIAYNAGAAAVGSALEALSNIDEVTCTSTLALGMGTTFEGTLSQTNVAAMTANAAGLTGGASTVNIVETTPGSAGDNLTVEPNTGTGGHIYLSDAAAVDVAHKALLVGKTARSNTGTDLGILEVDVSSAATNIPKTAARFSSRTSATATTGFGVQLAALAEDASGAEETMGRAVWEWTDATDASEDANLTLEAKRAGANTDVAIFGAAATEFVQPVNVTSGGTGSTTASGARTALGLAIGTDVQAWDADLTAYAVAGNATTATALAANPTACAGTDKVTDIAADGTLSCGADLSGTVADGDKGDVTVSGGGSTWSVDSGAVAFSELSGTATDAQVPDSITVSLAATATALAANGANCAAQSFPLGVDASGAVESCGTSISGNSATATALAADPADCSYGYFATGVTASGVATCEIGKLLYALKSAAETVSASTTLQDDDALTFTVVGLVTYTVDGWFIGSQGSATPNLKVAFDIGVADTMDLVFVSTQEATSPRLERVTADNTGYTLEMAAGAFMVRFSGTIYANAGSTIKFRWAQGTASSTTTIDYGRINFTRNN